MTDGPTFFGPEGVSKGRGTPPLQTSARSAPPEPKPFREVDVPEAPRGTPASVWIALVVLAACSLAAGWFYTRPEAPRYDMTSKRAPLGRFIVTPVSFKMGIATNQGVRLTFLAALAGNVSIEPQIASKVAVQLIDDKNRHFDPFDSKKFFEVIDLPNFGGDTSDRPTNPDVATKRSWVFSLPEGATIRHAIFKDEERQTSVVIELWEKEIPDDWFK